jgi:hypothetical protein
MPGGPRFPRVGAGGSDDCSRADRRRVRCFLAEKAIAVLTEQIDFRAGEQNPAAYWPSSPLAAGGDGVTADRRCSQPCISHLFAVRASRVLSN